MKQVSSFISNLFACRIDDLPTKALVQKAFFYDAKEFKVLEPYIRCLKNNSLTPFSCEEYNPRVCGRRFGDVDDVTLTECQRALAGDISQDTHRLNAKVYTKYLTCLKQVRLMVVNKCSKLLSGICRSRSLKVFKTIRATMASMESLLKTVPNFRIIHLIRDPRAVALSRKNYSGNTTMGQYSINAYTHATRTDSAVRISVSDRNIRTGLDVWTSRSDPVIREAQLYCRSVTDDIKLRKRLEQRFPGRIYSLFFDEEVKNLKGTVEKINEFLNISLHKDTMSWLNRTSVRTANWKDSLTVAQNELIVDVCDEFFRYLNVSV